MGSREEKWISVHQKAASPSLSYPTVFPCLCPQRALGSLLCQRMGLWKRQGLCVEVISVALLKIKQKLVYDN